MVKIYTVDFPIMTQFTNIYRGKVGGGGMEEHFMEFL
jgi:hypothetical protein